MRPIPSYISVVLCALLLIIENSEALVPRQWTAPSSKPSVHFTRHIHPLDTGSEQRPNLQQQQPCQRRRHGVTSLRIGNFLGSDKTKNDASLPRDVKDAVAKCKAAVQAALQNKLSRMEIEMPVGAKFGVEKTSGKRQKRLSVDNSADGAPTTAMLEQSDRELARLFVEMFQPVGGENIAVVFSDAGLADMANKKWKSDYGADSKILAIDRKKGASKNGGGGKKKKGKSMGFAAKIAAEVEEDGVGGPFDLPDNIEVALFVAPGIKELVQVERMCDKVGMGTLVVLLNARLSAVTKFGSEDAKKLFLEEFEPVFTLAAAPQQEAPGCLLHRSYPNPWVLARKPKVGPPKPILTQDRKPTKDECQQAYDALELGDVEKGIENVLENVAGWFN